MVRQQQQNHRFFSTKGVPKGKPKQKPKAQPRPYTPSSLPSPLSSPPPPSRPAAAAAPPPPLPRDLFPNYSPSSSTPLPPPSMPKKHLLRRSLPLIVATAGAYVLVRSRKHSSGKDEETRKEISSVPVTSIKAKAAEKTAH